MFVVSFRFVLITLFLLFIEQWCIVSGDNQIDVDIFYDVDSSEWKQFVNNQLYPEYKDFKDIYRFRFYPLKKDKNVPSRITSNNITAGLKVSHSDLCYLMYNDNSYESFIIDYLKCKYSMREDKSRDECFRDNIGNIEKVQMCLNEPKKGVLNLYQNMLARYELRKLPAFLVNKHTNLPIETNSALNDLRGVLCGEISYTGPCVTAKTRIAPVKSYSVDIYFDINQLEWNQFVQDQLFPVFQDFKHIVTFRFFPLEQRSLSKQDLCYLMAGFKNDDPHVFDYLKCFYSPELNRNKAKCFNETDGDWIELNKCVNDPEPEVLQSSQIFLEIYDPTKLPAVIFNKKKDEKVNNKILTDLRSVLCKKTNLEGRGCRVYKATKSNKILLDIFFKSDSLEWRSFVQNQLYPSYENLKEYLELNFIPLGPQEYPQQLETMYFVNGLTALGNDLCYFSRKVYNNSQSDIVKYVGCLYKLNGNGNKDQCLEEAGGDPKEFNQCYDSSQKRRLLQKARELIASYGVTKLPTIVYNEKTDEVLSNRSLKNFKDVICSQTRNVAQICRS